MEYCGNTLCISATELVDGGIMSYSNYKTLAHRGKLVVVRRGGGSSQTALISVDSLPARFRNKVDGAFPAGDKMRLKEWILSNYEEDHSASVFFHSREQAGVELSAEKIREYVVNASVMNCCIRLYENARDCRKLFGEKYSWDLMTDVIEALRDEFGHTLPGSTLRFRKKVNGYRKDGYSSLISGKFGNQNTRKVDQRIERLVVSLAILPEKPYGADVHDMYLSFLCGELDVWDYETGEVMNPDEFTDRNGEPKELSESTIRNILNNPGNRVRIEKSRLGWTSFYHEQMPHMHRHSGEFSLSQITMDDVDLPRRMSGNRYVHAYYAYDVVSQCRVGVAYGMDKNDALVVECFRDMFRLIERNGWGIPAGIEVEQHLMSRYKEGFLRAGEVFRFVHFCAPQNSQEKYAEALNGAFKTTIAHKNHEGIGRWYGKGARRVEQSKISDSSNHTWEDRKYYSFEELVADDKRDNAEWNNTLHPNQKKYPGMTRWDVLVSNLNPTLLPYDKITLSRYIGEKVETSIRRNSTVTCAYREWWISGPEVLERLEPNNYQVDAYYIPGENGDAEDVYLFQGDKYIDKLKPIRTYSRVLAEQNDEDRKAYTEQQKYVSHFDKWIRDNAIAPVGKAMSENIQHEKEQIYTEEFIQNEEPITEFCDGEESDDLMYDITDATSYSRMAIELA